MYLSLHCHHRNDFCNGAERDFQFYELCIRKNLFVIIVKVRRDATTLVVSY